MLRSQNFPKGTILSFTHPRVFARNLPCVPSLHTLNTCLSHTWVFSVRVCVCLRPSLTTQFTC